MIRCLALLSTASALSVSVQTGSSKPAVVSSQSTVNIWDDVLSDDGENRATLHAYASKSGLEHRCFSRPLADVNERNIIERTLDSILTEIEDNAEDDGSAQKKHYVEYWTRQEWRHIEAHADVDENLSKRVDQNKMSDDVDLQSKYSATYQETRGYRYPTNGHVLYLQVGSEVKGPTCVFPRRSSGGDLLKSKDEGTSNEQCAEDVESTTDEVQLITVPAVAGRLLRFDGRDLHAVPRPHDLWMLPFVKGGAEYEPEEVWGRSVVLFNVWPGSEDPPLDVPLDEIRESDSESTSKPRTKSTFCNQFSGWNKVEISAKTVPSSPSESVPQINKSVKVWLLGNERRRDHPMRTVALKAPAEGGRDVVREALAERSQVTELRLRQQ